jgi:hypothetical protein
VRLKTVFVLSRSSLKFPDVLMSQYFFRWNWTTKKKESIQGKGVHPGMILLRWILGFFLETDTQIANYVSNFQSAETLPYFSSSLDLNLAYANSSIGVFELYYYLHAPCLGRVADYG